ncbi:MAG: hypothetical protein LBQ40_04690, partial [Clostridiales bacterium]|nr:hypothetical protein [Clostridiales bacterium]
PFERVGPQEAGTGGREPFDGGKDADADGDALIGAKSAGLSKRNEKKAERQRAKRLKKSRMEV